MNGTEKMKQQHVRALRKELERAKDHLFRWNSLGESLGRTSEPRWVATRKLREEGVKILESMVERAERQAQST